MKTIKKTIVQLFNCSIVAVFFLAFFALNSSRVFAQENSWCTLEKAAGLSTPLDIVNDRDINVMAATWGELIGQRAGADLNGDKWINSFDYECVHRFFGQTVGGTPTPGGATSTPVPSVTPPSGNPTPTGYIQGGYNWYLSAADGQNCNEVCGSVGKQCAAENWNDDPNCSIMKKFTNCPTCDMVVGDSGPYKTDFNNTCWFRSAGNPQNCASTLGNARRLCACQDIIPTPTPTTTPTPVWILGGAGESCETACAPKTCVPTNWNDDASCSIGKSLVSFCSQPGNCQNAIGETAPYSKFGMYCYYRTSGPQSCSATPPSNDYKRICQCE